MAKKLGRSGSGQSGEAWISQELAGGEFQDERLTKRFEKLFRQLSGGIGQSIPWACQDWTSTWSDEQSRDLHFGSSCHIPQDRTSHSRTASTSMVIFTSSPTSTPPDSSAVFHVNP